MYYCLFIVLAFLQVHGHDSDFDGPFIYQVTPPVDHGEGPHWDGHKNLLYFVDLHAGKIYAYDYYSKDLHSIKLNGDVTPVVPSSSDSNLLIVGVNRSVVAVTWDGKNELQSEKILVTLAQDKPTSRINDGKADKKGRIWFGTMGFESPDGKLSPNDGTLFKVSPDRISAPKPMIAPVNISNGMAWNKANDKFYYIDSPSRQIVQYDFDDRNGEISNRKVVFGLESARIKNGVPDGMTIDKDDMLWVALYGGGSVIKVDPRTGSLLGRVPIPAERVTSVAWGGPHLDILFVTTSRYNFNDVQKSQQPGAGSVYAVSNLGTSGLPAYESKL